MANAVLSTVREYTGTEVTGCPWRAFSDPFVGEVIDAWRWFDKGQLELGCPDADYRLVEGVCFFDGAKNSVANKAMQREIEERKRRG